jgi:hypothetical protein
MNTEQKNSECATSPNSLLEGVYGHYCQMQGNCRGQTNTQLLFIQGDRDALATVYFLIHSQHKLFHRRKVRAVHSSNSWEVNKHICSSYSKVLMIQKVLRSSASTVHNFATPPLSMTVRYHPIPV